MSVSKTKQSFHLRFQLSRVRFLRHHFKRSLRYKSPGEELRSKFISRSRSQKSRNYLHYSRTESLNVQFRQLRCKVTLMKVGSPLKVSEVSITSPPIQQVSLMKVEASFKVSERSRSLPIQFKKSRIQVSSPSKVSEAPISTQPIQEIASL